MPDLREPEPEHVPEHQPEHQPARMPKPMFRVPMLLIVKAGDVYEARSITENVRDEFELRSVGTGTHRALRQP